MQRSPTCENCKKNYELRDCQPIGPRIPLLLPCGHTFCEGCLTKIAKMHKEIQCFTCKKSVSLQPNGEKGIANLLPNIYMLGLLLFNRRAAGQCSKENQPGTAVSAFSGIYNLSKPPTVQAAQGDDQQTTKQPNKVLCDECSSKSATCCCKSCDDSKFCDGCFVQIHRASKTLNKHTPLPLEYLTQEESTCSTHVGRSLEFFDQDLKEPVCAMCVISETCKGHVIIPISELEVESEEELTAAVDNAKDTLDWFKYSKEVMSACLSEEVMDTNQLFSGIHSTFTNFHTILLKRQADIMEEASRMISDHNGGAHSQVQKITTKMSELSKVIKDYEMIKDNKQFAKLKVLNKLQELATDPCIVKENNADEASSGALYNFEVCDEHVTNLNQLVKVTADQKERFSWHKASDFDEEIKDKLRAETVTKSSMEIIQSNGLLTEQLPQAKKPMSTFCLPQGHYELVFLTHIKDPLNFMIQRCSDKDCLQVMMTAINKYCRHATVSEYVYNVEEGQIFCAQFTADNHWYRAKVINACSPTNPEVVPSYQNGIPVEVLYIDYGNSEWLPLNSLRQLPDGFLEVPEMSIPCSLMDIVPPFKAVTWPPRSVKAFESLTGDRPMLMNIRQRRGGKLFVDLKRPDDDEPTQDDDRPLSVRDAMVFLDVAVFFSPSSFPNADIHRSIRDYPAAKPLELEEFVDVTVTHVENPHVVYVQRLDSSILEEQTHLSKLYSGKNKRAWKIDWPYRNLVCAAKFSADNTWYRAVVKHVNHDETLEVEYVDYGNTEVISFKNVKKIPDMYLKLPRQCVKVSLYNLEKSEDCKDWPPENMKRLEVELINRPFVCLTKGLADESDILQVILFDTSTSDDVNINDVIALKGIAKPINEIVETRLPTKVSVEDFSETSSQTSYTSVQSTLSGSVQSLQSIQSSTQSMGGSGYPKYLPPRMPNAPTFTATGVFVNDKAVVFLHAMMDETANLEEMMQKINMNMASYDRHPTDTSELHLNQACLGRYSQDKFWYRVTIESILNETEVKVEFVDFGNSEVVKVDELYMEAMYVEVPSQCISVQLANIEPMGDVWDSKTIALMKHFIEEKMVLVKIQGMKAVIYVEDNVDIAQLMLTKQLVRRKKVSAVTPKKSKHQQPAKRKNKMAATLPYHSSFLQPVNLPVADQADARLPVPHSIPDSVSQVNNLQSDSGNSLQSTKSELAPSLLHSSQDNLLSSQDNLLSSQDNLLSLQDNQQPQYFEYLWFCDQEVPKVGLRFDVTVTQVDQPDIVYIQRFPPSEDDPLFTNDREDDTAEKAYDQISQLEDLSYMINSDGYFAVESRIPKPVIGMACCARYSIDDLYYRARIQQIDEENGVADVVFVDYGTKETVSVDSIKPLTTDMATLPMQSIRVQIAGVTPNPTDNDEKHDFVRETKWTTAAMKKFFLLVANRRMIAQIVDVTTSIPTIHLYERCFQEDSETGETIDVLVGKVMLENGISLFQLSQTEAKIATL